MFKARFANCHSPMTLTIKEKNDPKNMMRLTWQFGLFTQS